MEVTNFVATTASAASIVQIISTNQTVAMAPPIGLSRPVEEKDLRTRSDGGNIAGASSYVKFVITSNESVCARLIECDLLPVAASQ